MNANHPTKEPRQNKRYIIALAGKIADAWKPGAQRSVATGRSALLRSRLSFENNSTARALLSQFMRTYTEKL
jgi:hypothetical protein